MTIVIDSLPVLSAIMASAVVIAFIAVSVWLAAYSFRSGPPRKDRADVRSRVIGVIGTVFGLVFAALWWRNWSPWAVEITHEAVELRYLLSTRRIELSDVDRVEFELMEPGGRRERSTLRVSSGGLIYQITQDPEPSGGLETRPVRQVFDQLAARLPADKCRDVTE